MKARLFLVIAIAATMICSCQFDDVLSTPSDDGVIRVTSSLTKAESQGGSTAPTSPTDNFKSDEIIYVWADKTSSNDGYIQAWKLKAKDNNGNFDDNGVSKAWPYDGSSLDFHALHGNFTESDINDKKWSDLASLKHTVLQDQSTDANRRKSDLLYAEKSNATHGNNVELSFNHLLAKITVKLDLANSMGITTDDFDGASVSILGIQPEAYFNSSSPTAPTSGGTKTEINAGTITKPSDLSSQAYDAGCAIVPLQTITANSELIKIELKDRTFIYKASEETKFKKGQEYTYTLIIRGKQITGTLSVSPFTSASESISFKDYFDYLADLKNRNYLGNSSAPHDLSYDYNGLMNTANCYVITHPGYYKFPLVYGNAIKNGATNSIAYGVGTSSTTFVNHLGAQITDPYIYNNANCTVGSAELVWQDAQYLIRNIALTDNNKYIQFEITKENIEQGNAVIAVKNSEGTIMWSWHIWVTNKNVYETYTYGDYNFMPIALGQRETAQGTTCTFYQWGRKDPFRTSGHTVNNGGVAQSIAIQNPGIFYKGISYDWSQQKYNNGYDYWNVGNTGNSTTQAVTKSIYDPSPVGYKLPPCDAFSSLNMNTTGFKWSTKGYSNTSNNDFWHAFGILTYSGSFSYDGTRGYYWSASPMSANYGYFLYFDNDKVEPQSNDRRADGCSVRPVSE